jgi:predicted HicB family RNase H-like nuclease
VSTAIRFPRELHARVVAEADHRDVSMNWIVNRAVESYVDRIDRPLPPPPWRHPVA